MACRNCNDQGGRYVTDNSGEREWDPCCECDAFSKQVAEQKRCDKAREAIRHLGYEVWISRREVLIRVNDEVVVCKPTPNGNWNLDGNVEHLNILAGNNPIWAALRGA